MSSISISYMCTQSRDERNRCGSAGECSAASPAGMSSTEAPSSGSSCGSQELSSPDSMCVSSSCVAEQQPQVPRFLAEPEWKGDGLTEVSTGAEDKDMPYSCADLLVVEYFYTCSDLRDSHPETLKLILRAVNLLRSCGYPMLDVCCVLAHASMYFEDATAKCGSMAPREAGRIAVVFMYLAHSYVLDESCPLKYWQQYLFADYCSVKTLDRVAMRVLKLRGLTLRVDADEVRRRTLELYRRRAKN